MPIPKVAYSQSINNFKSPESNMHGPNLFVVYMHALLRSSSGTESPWSD